MIRDCPLAGNENISLVLCNGLPSHYFSSVSSSGLASHSRAHHKGITFHSIQIPTLVICRYGPVDRYCGAGPGWLGSRLCAEKGTFSDDSVELGLGLTSSMSNKGSKQRQVGSHQRQVASLVFYCTETDNCRLQTVCSFSRLFSGGHSISPPVDFSFPVARWITPFGLSATKMTEDYGTQEVHQCWGVFTRTKIMACTMKMANDFLWNLAPRESPVDIEIFPMFGPSFDYSVSAIRTGRGVLFQTGLKDSGPSNGYDTPLTSYNLGHGQIELRIWSHITEIMLQMAISYPR